MRVGDLVQYQSDLATGSLPDSPVGLVVRVDDSHRQTLASVLFFSGLKKRVWEGHLKVINESR